MPPPLRNFFLAAGLFVAAAILTMAPARGAADSAQSFIEHLGNEAVAVLQSDRPSAERQAMLEDLFRRGFDLDAIGRSVLGRYWKQATPEQQAAYRQVYPDYVVRTYARQLADETVSGFSITGVRAVSDQEVLVETTIERLDGPALRYDWSVRSDAGEHKITDIVVEGISLLTTQRADFASIARVQGIDGLIQALKKKLAQI